MQLCLYKQNTNYSYVPQIGAIYEVTAWESHWPILNNGILTPRKPAIIFHVLAWCSQVKDIMCYDSEILWKVTCDSCLLHICLWWHLHLLWNLYLEFLKLNHSSTQNWKLLGICLLRTAGEPAFLQWLNYCFLFQKFLLVCEYVRS